MISHWIFDREEMQGFFFDTESVQGNETSKQATQCIAKVRHGIPLIRQLCYKISPYHPFYRP
jgi:hypothetical protein